YDIIGLQETKTDDSYDIQVPGFEAHIFNRKKLTCYRSGDKNSHSDVIKFFTISRNLYGDINSPNSDLKCGGVYIPPSGSRFAVNDPYFEMQNEIFRFCGDDKNILLFGDFNSRCVSINDFTMLDDFISELFDLENIQDEEAEIEKSELFSNNIDLTKVAEMEMKLDNLGTIHNIDQTSVNNITDDIAHLYTDCSKVTFGTVKTKIAKENTYNYRNPWFDSACINTRNKYHKTKRAYNKYKTQALKELLKSVSKEYTLRKARNKHSET
ncbi:hypothetical protein MAR_007523, partial [Mya arenaria]